MIGGRGRVITEMRRKHTLLLTSANCPTSQSASLSRGRLQKFFAPIIKRKNFGVPLTGAGELRYNNYAEVRYDRHSRFI